MAKSMLEYQVGLTAKMEFANPLLVRTIFLSDVHLATRTSKSQELLSFLKAHDASLIYLVGDIVDFWRIRRGAGWRMSQTKVIAELVAKAERGCKIIYIPGNHDDEMRQLAGMSSGNIEIRLRDMHSMASGETFLIMHGDEFDIVMKKARWLALLGDIAYEIALTCNSGVNAVRRLFGLPYWSLSAYLKARVKNAVSSLGRFEDQLSSEAKRVGADGVICGHIHRASMETIDGIRYINTGDWVESCTALIEHIDGRLELVEWAKRSQAFKRARRIITFHSPAV